MLPGSCIFHKIGRPEETLPPERIKEYRIGATSVYRRRFSGGLVLVNPGAKTETVGLGGEWLDPESGKTHSRLTMAPQSGKILLRKES